MRRFLTGIAAVALTLAGATFAQAKHHGQQNVIRNSGNGIQNTISARNTGLPVPGAGWASPGTFPGALGFGVVNPNGRLPVPVGAWGGGGWTPHQTFPGTPGFGGVNRNVIATSGNGIGNTIQALNRGQQFGGYPVPCVPGVGGVNVNVITNSGNGIGNTVTSTNGGQGPGSLNINVITNSGNGSGNTIGAYNIPH